MGDTKDSDFYSEELSLKFAREIDSARSRRKNCGPRTERGSCVLLQD